MSFVITSTLLNQDAPKYVLLVGLETREIRHVPEDGYEDRVFVKDTGLDHVVEIRKKMRELMSMVVNRPHNFIYPDSKNRVCVEYIDHQRTELPDEFREHSEELCEICNEYKLPEGHLWKKVKRGSPIRCQTRSLCAAVLWEKVKSLYPMSMAEFAERVGVTKQTINTMCKKMRQIDLN